MSKEWYDRPLTMTIGEITHEFRTAKHPTKMVEVLADLNSTRASRIWWILWQCGLPVDRRAFNKIHKYEDIWYQMHGAECAGVKQILAEMGESEMEEENKVVSEAVPERDMGGETPAEPVKPVEKYRVKVQTVPQVDKGKRSDYIVSLLWDIYLNRRGFDAVSTEMVGDMRELMTLGELAAGIVEGDYHE